ncbi:replication initiator protein A [Deinococcus sp. DB0503]|uniref:replication initiator protein A n=1 Tax=Deinococcus sp. DB0503 TaxID=2479203 RepID=UPI0018DF55D9|nr:replication initiator protein A [Deinococcus sp. DB0503]
MLRGHDEKNVASLIFVPTQERLPEDMLRLERIVFRPNGQPARIVCVGVPGIGLARGSDNDLLVALINTYIEAGCPADGFITTTAYALLKLAGLDTTGQYYHALAHGLERMLNTTYHVTDGWFDVREKRYVTASFRIIDNLNRTHGEPEQGRIRLDRRSTLRIRLNDELTKSINAGYIKPLNLTVYQHLPSVGSRALYRLLDVYLDEAAGRGDSKPYQVRVPMMALAESCGLLGRRTDHVRKSLESMHAPLLNIGYLKEVDFIGRGSKTTVHYTYGEASSPINPEHVSLLTRHGVHRGVAEKYVRNLGDDVLLVVKKFEERRRTGEKINNEGGYLSKLLKEAASIVEENRDKALRAQETQRTKKAAQAAQGRAEAEQHQLFEAERRSVLEAAPEAAIEFVLSPFKAKQLERRGLSLQELDQMRARVLSGEVPASEMDAAVNRALMSAEGLESLKALL